MVGSPKKRARRLALQAQANGAEQAPPPAEFAPVDAAPLPGSMSVGEAATYLDAAETPVETARAEPQIDWAAALEPGIRAAIGYLEARQPRWKTSDAEVRALAQAWAPLAALYIGAASPWSAAILATAAWALPRLNFKRQRATQSESNSSPGPEGIGEELGRQETGVRP